MKTRNKSLFTKPLTKYRPHIFSGIALLLVYGCQGTQTTRNAYNDSVSSPMDSSSLTNTIKNTSSPVNETIFIDSISGKATIEQRISAADLPINIAENFSKDHQNLKVKIEGFGPATIKASISTKIQQFNVRINQIRLPNGVYDGPFSRTLDYKIPSKGEVWLLIGKSNMASGIDTGKFELQISAF